MKAVIRKTLAVAAATVVLATTAADAAPVEFQPGQVLTAAQLNESFAAADRRADEQRDEIRALKIAIGMLAAVSLGAIALSIRVRGRR
ncbi:hypothetical protein [Burkholderia glumae]|uniref:Secreted protein n=1 Tax=Burkholderia glumae TaxID=337 RepID=A0ABY5BC78_BURGL|nr:hypothetical protein [Burkholderia glumae]MCQ0032568.1 hypothetical protein [Burkholderia glumae]MCQ0035794.1 hypothetical protein [Burkholderia glumae]PJO24897.1 hypothetical protein Y5A_000350 [Burkholderia glumae AU6208]QHE11856.1 hypothetical protein GQR88_16570 [Burkholderia glumae AU6208]RQZ76408.1 hypothetical protein DF052_00170 [Burkholderia glumae]